MSRRVAAVTVDKATYPVVSPFNPSIPYPEYQGQDICEGPNYAYDGVRQSFRALGLDAEHFDSVNWNPLGRFINPGSTVVIKPNFVLSRHKRGGDLWSIITHPSIIRAVADYVAIALGGSGRIIVADAPQYDCDWSELAKCCEFDSLVDHFEQLGGPTLEFIDLRSYWSAGKHFDSMRIGLPGDPLGSSVVDLGPESQLGSKDSERFYGAVYHRAETARHHVGSKQEYEISNTILTADTLIFIPKMKIHKKVGVTLAAKGLVGICTNKNFLVHYSLGSPARGGDQYPIGHFTKMEERIIRLERWMYDHLLASRLSFLEYVHRSIYVVHRYTLHPLGIRVSPEKRKLDAGNWHGNDSAWRMTADLVKLIRFTSPTGEFPIEVERTCFTIIDGIVGGENEGPLLPDAKASGAIVASADFLAADLVATRLMGIDPSRLPIYASEFSISGNLNSLKRSIEVVANDPRWEACMSDLTSQFLGFRTHPGWTNTIEVSRTS